MNLAQVVSLCESMRGMDLRGRSSEDIQEVLEPIFPEYRPAAVLISDSKMWARARVAPPEGFQDLRDCIHPPADLCDWGRANDRGHSTLYAATNLATAVNEVRAEPGQHVQLTYVVSDKPTQAIVVGEFEHVVQSGGVSSIGSRATEQQIQSFIGDHNMEDQLLKTIYLDAFFADLFSRNVKLSYEHKLTAGFARRAFEKGLSLIYPSVATRGGYNVAIPPQTFEESFSVVHTELIEVIGHAGYGVYDLRNRKASYHFRADGTFDWQAPSSIQVEPDGGRPSTRWKVPRRLR